MAGISLLRQSYDTRNSYGSGESRIEVLKKINAEIDEGEFCVIFGPSGSGKSMLLNIIGGIAQAESGYIFVNGWSSINYCREKIKSLIYY